MCETLQDRPYDIDWNFTSAPAVVLTFCWRRTLTTPKPSQWGRTVLSLFRGGPCLWILLSSPGTWVARKQWSSDPIVPPGRQGDALISDGPSKSQRNTGPYRLAGWYKGRLLRLHTAACLHALLFRLFACPPTCLD